MGGQAVLSMQRMRHWPHQQRPVGGSSVGSRHREKGTILASFTRVVMMETRRQCGAERSPRLAWLVGPHTNLTSSRTALGRMRLASVAVPSNGTGRPYVILGGAVSVCFGDAGTTLV